MSVSPVGAVSSTHGNVMGGRTIFPAFSCNGDVCTVTAPPNAQVLPVPPGWHQLFILDGSTSSHGVFVVGDPAELDNWPALAGFDLPVHA